MKKGTLVETARLEQLAKELLSNIRYYYEVAGNTKEITEKEYCNICMQQSMLAGSLLIREDENSLTVVDQMLHINK